MKIVIIEDEQLIAVDLAETIQKVEPDVQIISILKSVSDAIGFFKSTAKMPDLVFSDIQLGDGLSFEIFNSIECSFPVIFCTAYNEYALNAFRTNGIDYILKPFSEKTISDAFVKYRTLKKTFSKNDLQFDNILKLFDMQKNQVLGSLLVYHKDKIFPVRLDNIAIFYIENESTYLITFDNTKHSISKTLEELDKITSTSFYRVNRQNLINRKAIREVSQYFARKLSISLTIPFAEKILIRKEKMTDFLNWLSAI